MKKKYTISVFTEDKVGLLNKVAIIFTRRKINIESITASESEVKNVHRYTILITETEETVKKVVLQLEKQVEIIRALFHVDDDIVYQEIALYKVPTYTLINSKSSEEIIRSHYSRIIYIDSNFTIIEKTGCKKEIQALFKDLKPWYFGVCTLRACFNK